MSIIFLLASVKIFFYKSTWRCARLVRLMSGLSSPCAPVAPTLFPYKSTWRCTRLVRLISGLSSP